MIIELSDFFNNPSLVELGPIKIQYYAITWLLSAVLIYLFLRNHEIIKSFNFSNEKVSDLVFTYGLFLGAFAGGRVGYMLFYGTEQLLSNPLSLFYVWQGGMSFHGGMLGVALSFYIFSKQNNISFLKLCDALTLSMPIGLGLVRVGNFLNGELYGRETDGSWGFIFPTDYLGLARHPSQLYEAFGEGLILFFLLRFIYSNNNKKGIVCSSFLIFYGLIRFIIENYRQPDSHLGFLVFDLSMGQILCIPMIIVGSIIFNYSRKA
jgi:phosphatidylglycerol:prolipoprotein diacylglycerol transferase